MAKWIVIYICCILCSKHLLAQANGQYTLPFSSVGSIRDMVAMPDSGYCLSSAYVQPSSTTPPFSDNSNLIRFDKYNTVLWCKNFSNYIIKNIAIAANSDFLTAGYIRGPSYPILSIQRCDRNGNIIWRKVFANDPVYESYSSLNYLLKVIELSDGRIAVINGYGAAGTQTITLLDRLGNFIKVIKLNAQPVDIMEGFNSKIIVLFQPTSGFTSQDVFTQSGVLEFDLSLNLLQTKKYGTRGGVTFYQCFKDSVSNSYYLCGAYSGSRLFWQGEAVVMKVLPSLTATSLRSVRFRKRYKNCESSIYRFGQNKDGIVAVESGATNLSGNTTTVTEPSFDNNITKWRATSIALDINLNLQWANRQVIASFDPRSVTNPSQGYIITQMLGLPTRILYAGNNDLTNGRDAFVYQLDTLGGAGSCLSTPNPVIVNNITVALIDTTINFIRYAPVIRAATGTQSDGAASMSYQCVQRQQPVSQFGFYQQPQYGNFPAVVCQGSSVSFLDSSWHEPETWQWIFPPQADLSGADDTSCFPNVYNVLFTQAGTFPIKLVTTNEIGTDTLTKYITVINFTPRPDLGRDTTICPGDSVRLIHHSVPNSTHYFSRVGGGFYSTNDTVLIRLAGTYVCVATSACGIRSDTIKISIAARPGAGFTFSINCASFQVRFRDMSNPNGSPSLLYQWRFLDKNNTVLGTSALQSPAFTYPGLDTFKAVLVVRSPLACVQPDTVTKTIIITAKPVAAFTYTNSCGSPDALFTNSSTVATGSIQSNTWLMGDGNYSFASSPLYTYNSFGTYIVKLVVTNAEGCDSDTAFQTVVIKAKPVALIAYDTATCAASSVLLRDSSIVDASTIQSYWWQAQGQTYTQANIQQLFASAGNYTVLHAVTSVQGCASDTLSQNIFIESIPIASFATPAQSGCAGQTLTFSPTATIGYGQLGSGQWAIGNGQWIALNGTTFSNTFPQVGSYTVRYRAISSHSCISNAATQMVSIGSVPVASFSFDNGTCTGKAVPFINTSTNAAGAIASSRWQVGSGAPITTNGTGNYTYTFGQPGTYPVRLEVSTAAGCSNTTIQTITIVQTPAGAGPDIVVRAGEVFQLYGSGGSSYLWQPSIGLNSNTVQRPVGRLQATQVYTVQATTADGCIGKDEVQVTVLQPVVLPNAFSPNGDGINDVWQSNTLSGYSQAVLQVFDRYGQLVHQTKGSSTTLWDGKKGDKPVPAGTYYFILTLNSPFNDKPLTGWVMVLR